jgi:hypothetical protein
MSNLGALMATYLVSQKNTDYCQADPDNQEDIRNIENWEVEGNLDEINDVPVQKPWLSENAIYPVASRSTQYKARDCGPC